MPTLLNRYELKEELETLLSRAMPGEWEEALSSFLPEVEEEPLDKQLQSLLDEISDCRNNWVIKENCRELLRNLVEVEVYEPQYSVEVYL